MSQHKSPLKKILPATVLSAAGSFCYADLEKLNRVNSFYAEIYYEYFSKGLRFLGMNAQSIQTTLYITTIILITLSIAQTLMLIVAMQKKRPIRNKIIGLALSLLLLIICINMRDFAWIDVLSENGVIF